MLAQIRTGAPRLRLGALVVVGVLVIGLIAVAVSRPDVVVAGQVTPTGALCVGHDARMWTSDDTVVAPGIDPVVIEGTWTATGPQTAELTTAAGRTISLRTDQAADDQPDDRSCALLTR